MRCELAHTYIVSSKTRVLYIGMTGDLRKRIFEHRQGEGNGFAGRDRCNRLVWLEAHADVGGAIAREKELKGWLRVKKIALIETSNYTWVDLSLELFGLG